MKNLKDIILEKLVINQSFNINEKLIINKNTKINNYNYHPKDRDELEKLVKKLIKERGNEADLNDIDTSKVTQMWSLFEKSKFDGDISEWDVSNVESMAFMFNKSKFTGKNSDLSNWDVHNVRNMTAMFQASKFNGDISNWNVNLSDYYMDFMFYGSPLQKNLPKWYHE